MRLAIHEPGDCYPTLTISQADFPVDPVEQNRAWYRIYKTMENDTAVRQVHRDFLRIHVLDEFPAQVVKPVYPVDLFFKVF